MRTTRIRLYSKFSDEDDVDEEPSSSASAGGVDEMSVRAGMEESLEDMASSDMGRSLGHNSRVMFHLYIKSKLATEMALQVMELRVHARARLIIHG